MIIHVLNFHDQTEAADGDGARQREGRPRGETAPSPPSIAGAIADAQPDQRVANGPEQHPDRRP